VACGVRRAVLTERVLEHRTDGVVRWVALTAVPERAGAPEARVGARRQHGRVEPHAAQGTHEDGILQRAEAADHERASAEGHARTSGAA
jgi:hypothetical protein